MNDRCLLAVFAHPDDESFMAGVFRRAHDSGVRTALVCATRGESGEISDPALATPRNLGAVREAELRAACAIMKLDDLSLLPYRDGALAVADAVEVTGRLVRAIRRLRPQVVITFGANGGYGHTDHMAIHHLTVRAFHEAGDPTCYRDHLREGLAIHSPQKLYAVAFARSTMEVFNELAAEDGAEFLPGGDAATIPPEEMGTADDEITTVVTLTDAEFAMKMRAMQAHRTQMGADNPVNRISPDVQRRWLGSEQFVLLHPPGAPGDGRERDLFSGVVD